MKKAKYCLSVFLLIVVLIFQTTLLPDINLMSVSAAVTPIQFGLKAETDDEYICDYEPVASDSAAILYADKKRGHIALQNIKSGHIWYSVPNDFLLDDITVGEKRINIFSDIVIEYILSKDEGSTLVLDTVSSHVDCVRNGKIESSTVNSGIEIKYTFSSISTTVVVRYTLENGSLKAMLRLDKLKIGKGVKISSIRVLPSFGAGNSTDNGYLFVPDGCGAIINFNNQVETIDGYSGMVYGDDLAQQVDSVSSVKESVRLPVFGIKKANEAIVGIVESGDSIATIKADNGNQYMGYNIVFAQADLHPESKITLYENDWANRATIMNLSSAPVKIKNYTVRYTMLSGNSANYVGMAEAYRNYLLDEKGVKRNSLSDTMYLTLYGAADFQRVFLGIPYTKIETLTTFSQAEKILDSLKQGGVDDISLRFVGWNNSGISNIKLPKNLSPISKLGGNKGLAKLIDYCRSNGFKLNFDVDFQDFRKSGNGYSKNGDSTKTTFGKPAVQNVFMRSVYTVDKRYDSSYLLTPAKLKKASAKLIKSIPGEINGISLSTLGNIMYSDLSDEGVYRSETLSIYNEILKEWNKSVESISFDNANAYTFPYADYITNTPLSSSGYKMFDMDVPFYQIVLHGCVNMSTSTLPYDFNDYLVVLKSAELGLNLSYNGMYTGSEVLKVTKFNDLYSTTYTLWLDSAVNNYKILQPLLKNVSGALITEHYITDDNLTKTVFDNGVTVYVNYSEKEVKYEGVTVPALEFVMVEGS